MNSPLITVVITTRNRRDDIGGAIESVRAQSVPAKILVMDDESSDGTSEWLANYHPEVQVIRSNERLGLIAQRNRAARAADTPFIFSLDDDARMTDPGTLEACIRLFSDPRIGAVAVPAVNVVAGQRQILRVTRPPQGEVSVTNVYIGCAHALRREQFIALGGYENVLFQWGEEDNYCQKLYASGLVVAIADCAEVEHFPHPVDRHTKAKNIWIYRNTVLNIWFGAPWWAVLPAWFVESGRWIWRGMRTPRALPVIIQGLARGFRWVMAVGTGRRPMPSMAYLCYLTLRRRKVLPMRSIMNRIPQRS